MDEPLSDAKAEVNLETMLAELENIVVKLEGTQLPLEQALVAYRRGTELVKSCEHILHQAEERIKVLDMETQSLRDLSTHDTR